MVAGESELLAAVERSPRAAGAHDRAGWVGLFTADGRIEDPVGADPHIGRAAIERFYDTFIGPREITFRRDVDLVAGQTVVRDLTLEVAMGPRVTMRIPAFLRYVLRQDGGALKISELQAFWELPSMMAQFARNGPAAAPAGLALGRALLANQGLSGTLGFLRGLARAGRRERAVLGRLLRALNGGDELATRRLLAGAAVSRGDDAALGFDVLGARLRGAVFGKRITAGRAVVVAARTGSGPAVLITEFDRLAGIRRLRVFG